MSMNPAMKKSPEYPVILLKTLILCMFNISLVSIVHAAQDTLIEDLQNALQKSNPHKTMPHTATPFSGDHHQTASPAVDPHMISGRITNILTSAGFTYAEIDTGTSKVWAASPIDESLKNGDTVSFSEKLPMQDFHSKSLKRDFRIIYFIKQFTKDKHNSSKLMPIRQSDDQAIVEPISTNVTTSDTINVGGYLREAKLDGLNVGKKSFSDYKGKPLIINIWASWCGPCRAEMGSLERLAQRYNGNEYNIIGISTDDYRDKAIDFIKQTGISFDNYIDHDLKLEKMLGANTIPLTVLVSAEGRVLQKVRGSREWDKPEIISAIDSTFSQIQIESLN